MSYAWWERNEKVPGWAAGAYPQMEKKRGLSLVYSSTSSNGEFPQATPKAISTATMLRDLTLDELGETAQKTMQDRVASTKNYLQAHAYPVTHLHMSKAAIDRLVDELRPYMHIYYGSLTGVNSLKPSYNGSLLVEHETLPIDFFFTDQ